MQFQTFRAVAGVAMALIFFSAPAFADDIIDSIEELKAYAGAVDYNKLMAMP